jgi:hypothetical protein
MAKRRVNSRSVFPKRDKFGQFLTPPPSEGCDTLKEVTDAAIKRAKATGKTVSIYRTPVHSPRFTLNRAHSNKQGSIGTARP